MQADVVIIGGGIAGVSAAYFLSPHGSVILVERESALGTHSSARTAGQFTVGIHSETMRRLATASRPFLEDPPPGFAPYPILAPRGCLTVARREQSDKLDTLHAYLSDAGADVCGVTGDEAVELFPALRPENAELGVYEADAMDIDVDLLLQSYLKGAKANGARVLTDTSIDAIRRVSGTWQVETSGGVIAGARVLNAAGAWVDDVTVRAGLDPIGLTPCRRTAFTFAAPGGVDVSHWPHVSNLDYQWYVHPERHSLMGSLAETIPTEPGDVYPEDIDVAQAIHNIEQDTSFRIARPIGVWAGLRSFVADKSPVLGTRPDAAGFYWLAGHGGCGVLSSPALGRAAAALLTEGKLPADQRDLGLTPDALSPCRPSLLA